MADDGRILDVEKAKSDSSANRETKKKKTRNITKKSDDDRIRSPIGSSETRPNVKSPTSSQPSRQATLEGTPIPEDDSDHRSLSRPSSRASQASSFMQEEDFKQNYKKMKQILKEKEERDRQEQREYMMMEQERNSPGSGSKGYGQPPRTGRTAMWDGDEGLDLEKRPLHGHSGNQSPQYHNPWAYDEPPDPAVILRKIRHRRLVVLVIIFVGLCLLPFPVQSAFKEHLNP